MISFLKNKYVQSVLIFVIIVGGYVLYKNFTYNYDFSIEPVQPEMQTESPETADTESGRELMESMESMDTSENDADPYDGIHIMPDGTVMLGSGETLPDATVTEEGMIELPDGTQIAPLMDLRK